MLSDTNKKHIEGFSHKTQSRPFALHHTITIPELEPLYLHCHPEIEIFYLTVGRVDFFIEDEKYTLNAGDAIMIPPDFLHNAKYSNPQNTDCEFYAIVFSTDMLTEIVPAYSERYLLPITYHAMNCIIPIYKTNEGSWQNTALSCLDAIFATMGIDVRYNELIIRGNLLIIWQLLYNNHMYELISSPSGSSIQPYLKKCVDYIDANYSKRLTLSELSGIAGLSTGHFCRQFKDLTGYTPFAYINKRRIISSCRLLINTNKKIAEIASLCGFNNISYFNRAFIKIMKESPSAYRKNYTE